jgi:hypothetical protein
MAREQWRLIQKKKGSASLYFKGLACDDMKILLGRDIFLRGEKNGENLLER